MVVHLGPSREKKAIPCVNESHCVSLPAGLLSRSQWTDLNLSPYINIPKEVKPISSKDKEMSNSRRNMWDILKWKIRALNNKGEKWSWKESISICAWCYWHSGQGEEFCSRIHHSPEEKQSNRTGVLTSTDGLDGGILFKGMGTWIGFFFFVEVICCFQCPRWLWKSQQMYCECFSNPNLQMRGMGVSNVDSSVAHIIFHGCFFGIFDNSSFVSGIC